MKTDLVAILRRPPRLTRLDIAITLLGLALWGAGVWARPMIIQTRCVKQPQACTAEAVFTLDRPGLGLENTQADAMSDATQSWAGGLGAGIPLLWNGSLAAFGQVTPLTAAIWSGIDFTLILQTASWNGVFVELSHLLSQRPRPFVYARPTLGDLSSNYTSFYSGHTSFTAAVSIGLLLVLLSRGAPPALLILFGSIGQMLIVSTAIFRVLAGRHFVSDVLVGAVMGGLVALAIARLHRRSSVHPE